jgi:hypothetical protein
MEHLRIGSISARDVEPGDILVHMPYETWGQDQKNARVLGTVVEIHRYEAGTHSWEETRNWTVQLPDGSLIEHPVRTIGSVQTYVHVSRGGFR